jgi:hypothetical protein
MADDNIYDRDRINDAHTHDEDNAGDAEAGATAAGLGGAAVGALAGSAVGPLGTIAGAVIGGVAGAVAGGLGVGAVDRIDNDGSPGEADTAHDTTHHAAHTTQDTYRTDDTFRAADTYTAPTTADTYHTSDAAGSGSVSGSVERATGMGNGVPGIQTGGVNADGSPDTRGIWEKTEDTLTGDKWDDKQGAPVDGGFNHADHANHADHTNLTNNSNAIRFDADEDLTVGNGVPGIQTGGHTVDGAPDSRGLWEKAEDTVTGDKWDDKQGKRVA